MKKKREKFDEICKKNKARLLITVIKTQLAKEKTEYIVVISQVKTDPTNYHDENMRSKLHTHILLLHYTQSHFISNTKIFKNELVKSIDQHKNTLFDGF